MNIQKNDDVVIAGKVTKIENRCVELKLPSGDTTWISIKDIKTIRPDIKKEK